MAVFHTGATELFESGCRHRDGEGAEFDEFKAATLFKEAAQMNFAPAHHALGLMQLSGRKGMLLTHFAENARTHFERGAKLGHPESQIELAKLLAGGHKGVLVDYEEAATLLASAAEAGNAEAQMRLGCLYGKGQGVVQSTKQGKRFLSMAAAQVSPRAPLALQRLESATCSVLPRVPGQRDRKGTALTHAP